MAKDYPPEVNTSSASLRGADQISLEQLVSSTSAAVLRVLKEHESQESRFVFNPRIWCGFWIDLERFRNPAGPQIPGGPNTGPGLG